MAWILVPSLVSLRAEFNELAPGRDHASDGSIGDGEHSQNTSDHNPDETGKTGTEDADSVNEVHAIDVDKDLRRADFDMTRAVQIIVTRHREGHDDRLQNVIYKPAGQGSKIWSRSWGWTARTYTGPNPHDHHAHFSARYGTAQESDTRPWGLLAADATPKETDMPLGDDMITLTKDTAAAIGKQPGEKISAAILLQYAVLNSARANSAVATVTKNLGVLDAQGDAYAAQDAARDADLPARIGEMLGAGDPPAQVAERLRAALGDQAAEVGRLLAQAPA